MIAVDHHLYHHFPTGPVERRLDGIDELLRRILKGINIMSKEMDDLEAEVARNTSVDNSALVLIQSIVDKLAAAGTDPAKLAKLRADLAASSDALAAAVAANTPAETPPAPTP